MGGQNDVSRPSRSQTKRSAQLEDDSIMGTNNSSIVSKRSVEHIYFPNEPHFFRYFVKKPQRRSPLINRGYWLRMRAVDHTVRQFLEEPSKKQKIVINLGCGYDPLPWQCLSRYPAACHDVKFIDIDYRDLMIRKRGLVQGTKELNSMFTNMEVFEDGDVLLRSDQYLQLGCDLRDLTRLSQALASVANIGNSPVLFTAEVSITYMNVEAADALIKWAGMIPESRFCLLEQILPDGVDHPFAQTMMAHFEKLKTPLRAVQKYPSTSAQERRFKSLGWKNVSARNLWELWSAPDFMTVAERMSLGVTEPFDEWEEFALFGCHYFLLVADTATVLAQPNATSDGRTEVVPGSQPSGVTESVHAHMEYYENPRALGCRRFAAPLSIRSPNKSRDRVGNYAGMGLNTRMNSYDVFTTEKLGDLLLYSHGPAVGPSSRMCHTITDMGDAGALLVGGRTSPDNALADCWLYHKWLNTWERVDDLPRPRYRHSAVALSTGCILIATGKSNSITIDDAFLIWSRRFGWAKCNFGPGQVPIATYGATFAAFSSQGSISTSRYGILAGGLSRDGLLQQDVWIWEVQNFASMNPILIFKRYAETSHGSKRQASIARFGASTVIHHEYTYIMGGIVKDEILKASNEICLLIDENAAIRTVSSVASNVRTARPLLIGASVTSTGDSLLIMGGSAVCFSFGTFWNKGCYTLRVVDVTGTCDSQTPVEHANSLPEIWKYLQTVSAAIPPGVSADVTALEPAVRHIVSVPRMRVASSDQFNRIVEAAKPVILEELDLGSCTKTWTTSYLKEHIGAGREIIIHKATTEHMSFKSKNFTYVTKTFGDFIEEVENGGKLYLRSLSLDKPSELSADIARDFPSIAKDFRLPPELSVVADNIHSSPLRISGPVIMWLHYDVMANVLCQVQGSKRLFLFPPSDVNQFGFDPGASSSSINVFDKLQGPILGCTHPHEALLQPGDVLYLPPMWLHTASPTSGISVAVNVFFRNLKTGYAAGKDVYGNRDLQAYEKGRQDIAKIVKSFAALPTAVRDFYLGRLVKEFEHEASQSL